MMRSSSAPGRRAHRSRSVWPAGRKIAIIERNLFGGTCVNTGCIPTKTLIASARAAHVARRAADFGVMISGPVRVDMPRVKARKDAIVRRSNQGVTDWLHKASQRDRDRGHARFEGPHTIRVDERCSKRGQIFINVGGRAAVPHMPGLAQVPYLTNSSMMEVDFLPEHLVVVGGSYIGLEFAQMYRRFGSASPWSRCDRLIAARTPTSPPRFRRSWKPKASPSGSTPHASTSASAATAW